MTTRATLYEESGSDDLILPFQIDLNGVRGRLVRLGNTVDQILRRHDYPEVVSMLLAETLALTCGLAGALKYEGVFTLQAKGDGPVKTLVADMTSEGSLRGYANFDADAVAALDPEEAASAPVPRLLGSGYIAFTVDQGADTERYQGIVELAGATLSECTHAYFQQSEQLGAGVMMFAARDPKEGWRSAALMIQRLPYQADLPGRPSEEEYDDGWTTAMALMSSATKDELLDPSLSADRLVYRFFGAEGVRAYPAQNVLDQCRCSGERVETVLRALSEEELEEMMVDNKISVSCEFCKRLWNYDPKALSELRQG